MSGDFGWLSFVYFGWLRDPRWLPNSCDDTPAFSKTIGGNAKWDALFWFVLGVFGVLAAPFGIILEVLGIQMGCFLKDFGGLAASLDALGAQFAPGPPGCFQGRPLFSDFGAQREPKGVPKWSQNREKNCPKVDAKIAATFEGPLERCWLTLAVFLGPWTLENECLV